MCFKTDFKKREPYTHISTLGKNAMFSINVLKKLYSKRVRGEKPFMRKSIEVFQLKEGTSIDK